MNRAVLTEHSFSFDAFIDTTHEFLNARPVFLEKNTPVAMLQLLASEVDELEEAIVKNYSTIDKVAEVGDVIHFLNDVMKGMNFSPHDIVPRNGKPLETVADFRERSVHLAAPELKEKELLELCAILKDAAGTLCALISQSETAMQTTVFDAHQAPVLQGALTYQEYLDLELKKAKQVEEQKKLLNQILTALFLLSDKMHIDLVFAGIMKNKRNELKYPRKHFQDSKETTYEAARDLSRREWKESGGDEAFFREFLSAYPLQVLQILAE